MDGNRQSVLQPNSPASCDAGRESLRSLCLIRGHIWTGSMQHKCTIPNIKITYSCTMLQYVMYYLISVGK